MQPISRRPAEMPLRIGTLARLPVFLDLHGRPAIVAGGSAAAAWKAELLIAAGATVTVCARAPGEDMLALGESVILHRREWQPADLEGVAFAIIDCDSDAAAAAFRAAARRAGAICNVIDRPHAGDVQFGAIVNRSPVVVGISTDGAAPVLAQAVRRRIETVLPPMLGLWAATAKRIRQLVAARLPMASQRRAFWSRLSERAFADSDIPSDTDLVAEAMHPAGGTVTLVGAGPGDAELLTLKAMRALQAADVILFDDLVSDEILERARREAKRMLCRDEDATALMLRLARQGKQVVRLISGDPLAASDAGGEIAALAAAGIPVGIVPGIAAGMPLAASHASRPYRAASLPVSAYRGERGNPGQRRA